MGVWLLALAFFVTVDEVQLKHVSGDWVRVIRPDSRVNLDHADPSVRFFNNGRIPEGRYVNVRVRFTPDSVGWPLTLERAEDYRVPVDIRKGSFINVSFQLDPALLPQLSPGAVLEVRLTADQDERVDGSDKIKLWS